MHATFNSLAMGLLALAAISTSSQARDTSMMGRRLDREEASSNHLERRLSGGGRMTFYYPNTGPGACGKTFQNSQPIVAMNTAQFSNSDCYEWIYITYGGKTVAAQITDSCPSCSYGQIDVSPAVFTQFASEDAGILSVSWSQSGGGSGGGSSGQSSNNNDDDDDDKTTTSAKPKPTTSARPTTTWRPQSTSTHSTTSQQHTTTSSSESKSSSSSTSASSTSTSTSTTTASTSSSAPEAVDTLGSSTNGDDDGSSASQQNLRVLSEAIYGLAAMAQAQNGTTSS